MKNAVSNGGFFQLAARLYRYTGNDEYKNWAEKVWEWSASSVLLNTKTWNVADSANMDDDCKTPGNVQWTYNYGVYLGGAAFMYNKVSFGLSHHLRARIMLTTDANRQATINGLPLSMVS